MRESTIEIKIESLGGLGDGIASHDGKPVFVPKSVIGDVLLIKIIQKTSEFKRGEIVEILKAGKHRKEAPCPHFSACGGCSLQQVHDSHYREFKEKIATNSLRQAGFDITSVKTIFLPPASRRRAEFKILKNTGKYSLAYLGNRSHSKVAVNNCLILEPSLQQILPLLPESLALLPFIDDIESLSLTATDSGLEIIIMLMHTVNPALYKDSLTSHLRSIAEFLKLARITVADSNNIPLATIELAKPTLRIGTENIALPHNAFLQATRAGQKLLTEFAIKNTKNSKKILDLFCGIGTYSIALAENTLVHATDNHKDMIFNLINAAKTNVLPLTTEKRDLFANPFLANELKKYDAVIINPPRSGAKAQCEQIAASAIKNIVMISCNPATFARDGKILKNSGFTLQDALAIDQFVWSPHLEIAASFRK